MLSAEPLTNPEIQEAIKSDAKDQLKENEIKFTFLDISDPKKSFIYELDSTKENLNMKDFLSLISEEKHSLFKITDFYGFTIQRDRPVSYYRDLHPFYIEQSISKEEKSVEFPIFIKTLTGKTLEKSITTFATAYDLKEAIEETEGIPVDQMRLVFSSKVLQDDWTLVDYGVEEKSVINLILSLRGGGASGVAFVDITNEGKAEVKEWSMSAPLWRTVTKVGLCIEGVCNNSQCLAFERWVIISKGMGCYDVIQDKDKNFCPVCYQKVKPEKCAFTNCVYTYAGIKLENGKPQEKIVCPKEYDVGDYYKLFDPEIAGESNWISLKIITKPQAWTKAYGGIRYMALQKYNQEDICGICCNILDSEQELDCSHNFHKNCLESIEHLGSNCPFC